MDYIYFILALVIGYFIGSFNLSYFIAKNFYKIDLRTKGSGNLGGTNAGRVLGKKVALIVIIYDILKCLLPMILIAKLSTHAAYFMGFAVIIGHCFPYHLGFKGGKGFASFIGYLISLGFVSDLGVEFTFIIPLCTFLFVLGLSKIVSLSSILASLASLITIFILSEHSDLKIFTIFIVITIILKHFSNILRIIKRKENKISWLF